ncbi:MAG: DUF2259 domain-containing protein [Bradyrhizobiaceae bacterium]|nr:DUF2259 domain-containing protein [Bradyrhizobiaceae bacterium]
MWLRSLLIALLLAAPTAASGAEALALKVLGFSPDGRYFGFIQYGGVGDGGEFVAEAHVIDVAADRLVPGMPLRLESWKESPPIDDPRPYGEWLLGFAGKRFAKALSLYDFQLLVPPIAADEGARTGETFAISSDVRLSPGTRSIAFEDAKLGRVSLDLEEKRFPWPRTSRAGRRAEAIPCAQEVDWEEGVGFRLTLRRGKRIVVLNDDRTIPASRHCVLGYGISEVHTYARRDGKVSLAVVLNMAVRGFEGNDRLFLAVTAQLDR